MENQKNILNYFFDNINLDNINILINKIINNKNNIYITGIGKSYNCAIQISDLLKSISINCFYLNCNTLLHGNLGVINNNLIIIFSKSGNTPEILNIIDNLIERNCFLVGVFCNNNNLIEKKCNLNIYLPLKKEIDQHDIIPSISITLYTLFTNYLIENLSKKITLEEYSKNHPSGDIGNKIKLIKNIPI